LGRGVSCQAGAGGAAEPAAVSLPWRAGLLSLLVCTLWLSQTLAGQVSLAWDEASLPGPTARFTWTDGGASVAEWWVEVGTSIGANDLFNSGALGRERHTTVSGLPTNGEALLVRLWALIEGTWQFRDFQYTAASRPEATVRDARGMITLSRPKL
jgi:hypothetical protein